MDPWRHGTYVDLWSLVHLLVGGLLGITFFWIGLSFSLALLSTIVLLCAWELYEWLLKILEAPTNVFADIFIGMIGFLLAAYWHYFLGMPFSALGTGVLASLALAISFWGFVDLIVRGYR